MWLPCHLHFRIVHQWTKIPVHFTRGVSILCTPYHDHCFLSIVEQVWYVVCNNTILIWSQHLPFRTCTVIVPSMLVSVRLWFWHFVVIISCRNHFLWVQTSVPGLGDPELPLVKKITMMSRQPWPMVTLLPMELTVQAPARMLSNWDAACWIANQNGPEL